MSEGYEKSITEYEDGQPYTVIGSTSIPDSFGVFLTGEGLKAIVKKMREGEDLRITFYSKKRTEFEIVDTHQKYPKQTIPMSSNTR